MSATQDAMIWARERAAAGVNSRSREDLHELDRQIKSIKRYPVEGGSGSMWVTERWGAIADEPGTSASRFECSAAAWGCGVGQHASAAAFISKRMEELRGED